MISKLKNIIFSTRLTAVLFIVFATAMAFGTFIESKYSTSTARIWIYNTWWFEAIMGIFMINFIGNIKRYNLLRWQKWPILLLHISWVLIILGAFVTRYISYEGRMPIREGKSENIFYSDKTYLTAYVSSASGEIQKTLQDDLIVTPEGLKSSLPWSSDFNGKPFTISYVDFIKGAKKGLLPDENGKSFLKIVEAGDGSRHDHYLESGKVASIHGVLFALNKQTDGAINITASDSTYTIQSPFEGNFMRMADQFQGNVQKDSVQQFQLRSLYSMAGMQFVIPEPLVKGVEGIVTIPEAERTPVDLDALVVEVVVGDKKVQKKLLGVAGTANFSDKFTVGDLEFSLSYGSKVYQLPFNIKLNDFIAEKYPGTERGYASFMSKVTVEDERPFDYDIFMNNILDHRGYRFFQANFDQDEKGTVLSVNHDQWGTNITYLGYALLYIGLIGIMFFGKTRFKDLGKSLNKMQAKKAKITGILIFAMALNVAAQEHTADDGHDHSARPTQAQIDSVLKANIVPAEHAEKFGALIIQDEGGRMKPINTFSSELLRKLSRDDTFHGMNSDQVFLSMMMNPPLWYNTEFIILDKFAKNDSIRHLIGVPEGQKYVRALDFFDDKGNYKLEPVLREATATNNPDAFETDVKQAHTRVSLLDQALGGQIVKIFPLLNDENNKWISTVEFNTGQYQVSDSLYANFIKNSIPYYLMTLKQAKESGDYSQADKLLAAFHQNQKNHGSEVLPSDQKVKTEILYNKLNIFKHLYRLYGLFSFILFLVLILQIFKDRSIWRMAIFALKGSLIILFLWHTAGLILRWYISGHAPWSDAYESIIYIAWATMAISLLFTRKSNFTLAAGAFVACLLLMIASWNWVDPAISNLVPVLDSYWLMIHVSIIVGSYGPLIVGGIIGMICLLLIIMTTKKNKKRMEINLKELIIINELTLTVGLIMLTIGNFLGGQWANESWGRYWGWDPKETWALITIMLYAFIIHMRIVPGLRSKWLFSFLSLAGIGCIMMTYFGVNYYLVGLHSYGQSGGSVITPMFIKYIVLGVVILGSISFWRYRVHYKK